MSTSSHPARLLVFAREPVPGRVKTRLIPALGAPGAARLYRRLLEHSLCAAGALTTAQVQLWCDSGGEGCRELAQRFGATLFHQRGRDLGERMHRALSMPPPGAPSVLIGSDCPGYTPAYLRAAFAALDELDAVLGPALDGGYVLIGVRRSHARLFEDIAWGGSAVLQTTRERLRELGWRWVELPALGDVDRPDDLGAVPSADFS